MAFFSFFFLGLKKKGKLKKRTKSKDSFGGLVQILGAIWSCLFGKIGTKTNWVLSYQIPMHDILLFILWSK